MSGLKDRRFALIIDEAHSSQSGVAAQNLRAVLTATGASAEDFDEDITAEDVLNTVLAARQRPMNVSYFAFTATPKNKTLELFGRPGLDGTPEPFHIYSMRQAIEEGFIIDVLKNYVSYTAFYKLVQTGEDKEVRADEASKALGRYLRLHPHNIAQKVTIIIEHFRSKVLHKIGGKAKAMIVTDSRKAAVRYKLAFDKYLKEHGYTDCAALVAFSGTVSDPESGPKEFTEINMNASLHGMDIWHGRWRLLLIVSPDSSGLLHGVCKMPSNPVVSFLTISAGGVVTLYD